MLAGRFFLPLAPVWSTLNVMGFYYSPGTPDPKHEKSGGFRETLAITWVVFRVLAVPLGILLAVVLAFFAIFYLFTLSPFAGLGGIAAIILVIVARGVWEAKHPPDLS